MPSALHENRFLASGSDRAANALDAFVWVNITHPFTTSVASLPVCMLPHISLAQGLTLTRILTRLAGGEPGDLRQGHRSAAATVVVPNGQGAGPGERIPQRAPGLWAMLNSDA